MSVRILLTLSMLLILGGCSSSSKTPEPITVYHPVETVVPVKCEVPEVTCRYTDKGLTAKEVVREMYQCIIDLRKALEVCR